MTHLHCHHGLADCARQLHHLSAGRKLGLHNNLDRVHEFARRALCAWAFYLATFMAACNCAQACVYNQTHLVRLPNASAERMRPCPGRRRVQAQECDTQLTHASAYDSNASTPTWSDFPMPALSECAPLPRAPATISVGLETREGCACLKCVCVCVNAYVCKSLCVLCAQSAD